jgi:ribonuclease P protein subunit POP4
VNAKGLWELESGAEKWVLNEYRRAAWLNTTLFIILPRFDLFLPLHLLWMGYMSELLGLSPPPSTPATELIPNASSMHAKLVKADFHGSILTGMQVLSSCAHILMSFVTQKYVRAKILVWLAFLVS